MLGQRLRQEDGNQYQRQNGHSASDPIYELSFRLGFLHKSEDEFWHSTLENLAAEFGVQGQVQQENELIDPRMQWNEVNNVWRNAGVRSALYAPVAAVKNLLRPA